MSSLGELERAVMDALWDARSSVTAYDVQDRLEQLQHRRLATTTVLTVLSRLEKKGFVTSERSSRPHRYAAVASREDHVADLMHEALGGFSDRGAVLERFVGGMSKEDVAALRAFLGKSG